MFDHLDDPSPYVPAPELRDTVVRRGRSLRRRRRLAVGSVASVLVVVAGVVGASAMVDHKLDAVQRIDVAGLRTTTEPGDPKTILFVGADSDVGLGERSERTGPFRGDTIVLARVDPGRETVTVLPIPRDLLVDIPGHGQDRVNAAVAFGGPELLIDTIHHNLGIEVDHYLQADFRGAIAIGDALGGLDLSFPYPVRDGRVGLDAPAGCTTFDGEGLLAVARARHVEYLADGVWRLDRTSDLGRMERQQAVGAALMKRMTTLDASDPRELNRLLDAAVRDLTVDSHTTSKELLGLFRGIEGSTYRPLRYPVVDHVTDGGADVLLLGAGAGDVTAAFLDTPVTQPPAGPTVDPGAPATTTAPADTTSSTAATTTTLVKWPTPSESVPTPC
jgi:LCP family protein required for cell wall assembly